jgi:hypothetical protein
MDPEECYIGTFGHPTLNMENPYYQRTVEWLTSFIPKNLNCSVVPITSQAGFSTANETGYYEPDSYFGALQYNRVNILALFTQMSAFSNPDAVLVDVPIVGAKAIISNAVKPVTTRELDILETLDAFDFLFYVYFMIVVFYVFAISCHLIVKKSLLSNLWTCLVALMDQVGDGFDGVVSSRILYCHYLMFLLFFLYGIYGGLISADMTIPVSQPQISKLEDIFDDQFNVTPVFGIQGLVYNALYRTGNGSMGHRVIDRAIQRGSLIDFSKVSRTYDSNMTLYANKALKSLTSPQYALLSHDIFVEKMLLGACIGLDLKEPLFAAASQDFGQDILVFPYSHRIGSRLRSRVSEHLMKVFESGIFPIELDKLTKAHVSFALAFDLSPKHQECASFEFFRKKQVYEKLHPELPTQISIKQFQGCFHLSVIFSIISILTLALEKCQNYFVLEMTQLITLN